MRVTALIPVKGFRNAKQRLSPLLTRGERETLAELMFRDVLGQVLRARNLLETVVVTGNEKVSDIAQSLGARVIRQQDEKGETDAVDFARIELKAMGREAILIVPGDMPLVRSEDIEGLVTEIPKDARPPFALLVPSHDRLGTNALLLAPPDIIKLRFGYDSFRYHLGQVSAQGLPLRFIENERIALDIDEPKDLEQFLTHPSSDGETCHAARRMLAERRAQKERGIGSV